MKLLIITQKIDKNDDVLGFMHGWIREFAKHCDGVIAVGLFVGAHDLPENVRVYSLGKEGGVSRMKYLLNFFRIIWNERKNYDAVFVHMNQVYVLLGGLIWKLTGKKVALWYTHKRVDLSLRAAVLLADVIFTASIESFRIATPKCRVMGHGIDVSGYRVVEHVSDEVFRILSIGRISRTKGYETFIAALEMLKREGVNLRTSIVGAPITADDDDYADELQSAVEKRGLREDIVWVGAVPNQKIKPYLANADLFVNLSSTGSLDKAVLEAMAAGVPVLTSNVGLETTLEGFRDTCMCTSGDVTDLVTHIHLIMKKSEDERKILGEQLRDVVVRSHDLSTLIPRIVTALGAHSS